MNTNFYGTQVSIVVNQSSEGFTITISGAKKCQDESPCPHRELEQKVAACKNLRELYILLFATNDDSMEVLDIFTRRRLEIDGILPLEEDKVAA